jgi:hypothetical protein
MAGSALDGCASRMAMRRAVPRRWMLGGTSPANFGDSALNLLCSAAGDPAAGGCQPHDPHIAASCGAAVAFTERSAVLVCPQSG